MKTTQNVKHVCVEVEPENYMSTKKIPFENLETAIRKNSIYSE